MPDEELSQADAGSSDAGTDSSAESPQTAQEPQGAPEGAQGDPYESGATTFPREYVERLRSENQQYRQRWSPYEQSFSGLHPEDANALQALAQRMAQGDPEAARLMYDYAEAYGQATGYQQPEPQYQVDQNGNYYDPNNVPMTRAEVAQAFAAEREQAATMQQVASIESTVAQAFDPNQDLAGYQRVLFVAQNNGGDLQGAIQHVQQERETWKTQGRDEYLNSKRSDAAGAVTAPTDGGSPATTREPQSYDEMWEAAEKKFEAMG